MIKLFAIAFSVLISAQAHADARFQKLESLCRTDLIEYEKELNSLRKNLGEAFKQMSQAEYDKLEKADDASVIFLKVTYPGDLSEKNQFWKADQDCADVHFQTRKVLSSVSSSKKEKQTKVDDLRDCVLNRYNRKKVVAPYDKIIACYNEHAKKN